MVAKNKKTAKKTVPVHARKASGKKVNKKTAKKKVRRLFKKKIKPRKKTASVRLPGRQTGTRKGGGRKSVVKKRSSVRTRKGGGRKPKIKTFKAESGKTLQVSTIAKFVPKAAPTTKKGKTFERKANLLLAKGRERGFVTFDEILKEFPTIEKEVVFLEELYEKFSAASIDVLEAGGMLEDKSAELLANKNTYKRRDSSYDSIQMYLREIGQYSLLTAAQ